MICKIFRRGRGKETGIDYLLSENDASGNRRSPAAEIIRGDISLTKNLIKSLNFSQRYTSGALSWSESPDQISNEKIDQVIESFQDMVCTGIEKNRINWLWVKHQDKNRLELHFIIPNVDLSTGKRFAPYYHKSDLAIYRAWERFTNCLHEFSNPADPKTAKLLRIPQYLPADKNEAIKLIDTRLNVLAKAGKYKSRNDIINDLKSIGYKVNRTGKDYISIEDRSGKKLRLRGLLFNESFSQQSQFIENTDCNQSDLSALQIALNVQLEKRKKYHQSRYKNLQMNEGKVTSERTTNAITQCNYELRAMPRRTASTLGSAIDLFTQSIELFVTNAGKFIQRVKEKKLINSERLTMKI